MVAFVGSIVVTGSAVVVEAVVIEAGAVVGAALAGALERSMKIPVVKMAPR